MTQNQPSFKHEKLLWNRGFKFIAGVDEVGRGAFAGPLVAASVILPKNFKPKDIKDSKLLSPKKREILSEYIIKNALFYSIAEIEVDFINKYGVGEATHKALKESIDSLKRQCDFVLVDGFRIKNYQKEQKAIIHGDLLSVSIAAASIIAKVYRDNLMRNLDNNYSQYGFFNNKGYGTKYHREALKKHGLSEVHRSSFNLRKYL